MLLFKHQTQMLILLAMTSGAIYVVLNRFDFVAGVAQLPWLSMFACFCSALLAYQYKQSNVLFLSLLMIAYQSMPFSHPVVYQMYLFTDLVPQFIICVTCYLTSKKERGISWGAINEQVLTSLTLLVCLSVFNMLVAKHIPGQGEHMALLIVCSISLPYLVFKIWREGHHEFVVFAYIASVFGVLGFFDQSAGNFLLLSFGLTLITSVLIKSYQMAFKDELTGINSRRAMEAYVGSLGKKYAVVMCDVDHFKRFNDTYGHDTGDDVLRLVAKKLEEVSGSSSVFRYGGEEFCFIFKGKLAADVFQNIEAARTSIAHYCLKVRRKDRQDLSEIDRQSQYDKDFQSVNVTMSFGMSETSEGEPFEDVLKRADIRLYEAKEAGRNRVMYAYENI
jgi:diguanylate cyclase (GGDEF)-like protein